MMHWTLLAVMALAVSGAALLPVSLPKSSINSVARWDGFIYGDYHLLLAQIIGIVVTAAVAVVGTLICLAVVRIFTPLRVDEREEK